MNNRNFFLNAAMAFGLLAAGSSFAAETSATAPAANTPAQHEAAHAEMKAKIAKMTPEQRAVMQEKMHDTMAAHEHNAKAEGHEHMHAHDMHGAGGMSAR